MYMRWRRERDGLTSPDTQDSRGGGEDQSKPVDRLNRRKADLKEDARTADREMAMIRLVPDSELQLPEGIHKRYKDLQLRPFTEDEVNTSAMFSNEDLNRGRLSLSPDDLLATKEKLQLDLLKGNFEILPNPPSKIVRIFLSSTFSDMKAERTALHRTAHPQLQTLCQHLGLEFQAVDMRWGVTDEAVNDHLAAKLCVREIKNCQRLSAGPNFVTLIGNRYGYCPLQVEIPATEFESLLELLKETRYSSGKKLCKEWYWKDENAKPTVYVLQPIATILKHYSDSRRKHADLRKAGHNKWQSVYTRLHSTFKVATSRAVQRGLMSASRLEHYGCSVTEEEIHHGLLENPESSQQCVAFHRTLSGYEPHLGRDNLVQKYFDVIKHDPKNHIDEELQDRLHNLAMVKIPQVMEDNNLCKYHVEWSERGVTLDSETHQKYLKQFCEDYVEKLSHLIKDHRKKQGNDTDKSDHLFSSLMKEVEQHARFCNNKCATFCGRSDVLEKVQQYIKKNTQLPLILHGESGVGKTSVMAKVADMLLQWFPNLKLVLRFLGTTSRSSTITSLLQSVSLQICYLYNISLPSAEDLESFSTISKFFSTQLNLIGTSPEFSDRPLIILLDSLDQLSPANGAHLLTWLPRKLYENVHIIVSTIPRSSGILDRLLVDPLMVSFIELEGLDSAAGADVLRMRMEQNSRQVTTSQANLLEKAFKQCPQALYIKLAIDRALLWHSYDELQKIELSRTVQEVIIQLFMDLENKYGASVVSFALGYITVSNGGLSEVELEDALSCNDLVLDEAYQYHNPPAMDIIRIPPLLWARISFDLNEYLAEREVDGKTAVFWYHRQFIEGARVKFVDRVHSQVSATKTCCDGFMNHSHRLHSNLAQIFQPNTVVKRTIYLSNRDYEMKDADRGVTEQPQSDINQRWLNALPLHLMQPEFHKDETCQILRQKTLCNYDWLLAKLQAQGPSETMKEYNRVIDSCHCQHEEVIVMRDFLLLAESAVGYQPTLLATEIMARLPNFAVLSECHNIKKLVEDAKTWITQCKTPVIYPVQPCFVTPNEILKTRIVGPACCLGLPTDARFAVGNCEAPEVRLGIWSTTTNELLHILESPPGYADQTRAKVDDRGSILVSVEEKDKLGNKKGKHPRGDVVIRVYNPVEGTLLHRLCIAKEDDCVVIDLSADGGLLAVACVSGMVYVVDLKDLRVGKFLAHSGGRVENVRITTDGRFLVTSGKSFTSSANHVTVWSLPSLQEAHSVEIRAPVYQDNFYTSKNNTSLAAICGSDIVLVLQITSGEHHLVRCNSPAVRKSMREHLSCVAVSWDGRTAVVGGSRGHMWVVDMVATASSCQPIFALSGDEVGSVASVNHMAITWDGEFVMASTNGLIHILHLPSVTSVKVIHAHAAEVNSLMLSADHERLFSSSHDRYIKLWKVGAVLRRFLHSYRSKKQIKEFSSTTKYKDLRLSSDVKLAVLDPTLGPPEVWNIRDGRLLHVLADAGWSSSAVIHQVSLGADRVVALSTDGGDRGASVGLHVWDLHSYKLLTSLKVPFPLAQVSQDASAVVFVNNSKSGSKIKVWSGEAAAFTAEFSVQTNLEASPEPVIITCDKGYIVMMEHGTKRRGTGPWRLEAVDLKLQKTVVPQTTSNSGDAGMLVGDVVPALRLATAQSQVFAASRGSRYVVATDKGCVLEVDAKTQTVCQVFCASKTDRIKCMSLSDDSLHLSVGLASGASAVFDMISGDCLILTQSSHNQVWSVNLSSDKTLLACGHRNNVINIWDMKTQRVLSEMVTHADAADVVLSLDKEHIVAIVDKRVNQRAIFLKLQHGDQINLKS